MRRLHEMTYAELEKHAIDVISELKVKAYCAGYDQGKLDAEMEVGNAIETSQEKRDRIVEKAKKDVADLKERMISGKPNYEGNGTFRSLVTVVEFIVNKEKRTVVAIVKGHRSPTIYEKGIAKCAPNDCFNAHIGKAIALRRALGLDVPDEYYTAPQPTDVRIGNIIKSTRNWPEALAGPFYVGDVFEVRHDYDSIKYACAENSSISKNSIIIDDSREGGVN